MSDMSQENIPTTDETAEETSKPASEKNPLYWVFDYLEILVFSVCAVLIVFSFFCRLCQVSGSSMSHTLEHEQMLLTVNFKEPKAGDIVVFHMTGDTYNEPLVKRVIATEGQTIRIDYVAQTVSVDGNVLDEPYISILGHKNFLTGEFHEAIGMYPYGDYGFVSDNVFEVTVPENCYFVMGDNRNGSADSRSSAIGFVDERRILGTVVCRLKPYATAEDLRK